MGLGTRVGRDPIAGRVGHVLRQLGLVADGRRQDHRRPQLQRQFGRDFLVSASYLGNHVVHMLMTAALNPAIYLGLGAGASEKRASIEKWSGC